MVHNTMGNMLSILGDNARETIETLLSPDPDNPEEKVFDFSKIIPVNNPEDERECMEKWGVSRNANNTQYYYEGEGVNPAQANLIYFDSHDVVPRVIEELARQHPELYISYEYCDEDCEKAGVKTFTNGLEQEGCEYEHRGHEMISAFHNLWGRYDDFVWDSKKNKYIEAKQIEAE